MHALHSGLAITLGENFKTVRYRVGLGLFTENNGKPLRSKY